MSGVELRFPPTPGHVRTARLVAATVARRAGLDEVRLEDLRLAVGEACARAVRRCETTGHSGAVVLLVEDAGPDLVVEVADEAPSGENDDPVVLALLRGLADHLEVVAGDRAGGRIRLSWSAPLSSPGPGADRPGRTTGGRA